LPATMASRPNWRVFRWCEQRSTRCESAFKAPVRELRGSDPTPPLYPSSRWY
jgi:hypothetical protein